MPRLDIAVTGNGFTTLPAEHATLTLQLQSRPCPTAEEAPTALEHFITQLSETLALYCPKGEKSGQNAAIVHYSIATRDVTCHHERNPESSGFMSGSKVSVTRSWIAKADMHVVFADFSALHSLATQLHAMDNVRVYGVQWGLSDASLAVSRASSRKAAARDALQRARDYAEAVADLSPEEAAQRVKAINVKDMRKYDVDTKPKLWYGRKTSVISAGTKGKTEMHYEPVDVVVGVKVEARFVVEG